MNGTHILAFVLGMGLRALCAWAAVRLLESSRERAINQFLKRKGGTP
jgi:uncharacterized membrane protein